MQSELRQVQTVLPGAFFGHMGLLSRGRHTRTILAREQSSIAYLSLDALNEIEANDKVGEWVCECVSGWVGEWVSGREWVDRVGARAV